MVRPRVCFLMIVRANPLRPMVSCQDSQSNDDRFKTCGHNFFNKGKEDGPIDNVYQMVK